MIYKTITPIAAKQSQYGIDPSCVRKRAAELPNMVSVKLRDLFPDLPDIIFPADEDGIKNVREAARESLLKVDMTMIRPDDSVNVLASHHGVTGVQTCALPI